MKVSVYHRWLGWVGFAGLLSRAALSAQIPFPPANDHFADALAVGSLPASLQADLAVATSEAFEGSEGAGNTAWWRWIVPADGLYEWDTEGSSGPVALSVWSQDVFGQLVVRQPAHEVLTATNTVVATLSRGSFPGAAGESLWLRAVATRHRSPGLGLITWLPPWFPFGTNYVARFVLNRSAAVAPANDRFAARIPLVGTNVTLNFRLAGATGEPGEPRLPGTSMQRTAWWSWQAPADGTVRLRSTGTQGAPVFGVYRRGELLALEPVANSATEFGNACYREWRARDSLEWDVVAGTTYEVQADRYPGNLPEAECEAELTFGPAPAHDDARTPLVLAGEEFRLTVDNRSATGGPTDPERPSYGSLWFKWQAAGPGVLQVSIYEPRRFDDPSYELPGGGGGGGVEIITSNPCGAVEDLHQLPPFVPVFGLHMLGGATNHLGYPWMNPRARSTNEIAAPVEAGEYLVEFNSLHETPGESPMNGRFTPPPENDRFAGRIRLPSASVQVIGRTFAARPDFAARVQGRAAWWQWTAPAAGDWVLWPRPNAEQKLHLFRGAEVTAATPVRQALGVPLVFAALAAEVFQIAAEATTELGDNAGFYLEPVSLPPLLVERHWAPFWGLVDEFTWPPAFRLPRRVETSTNLTDWVPASLVAPDDYRVRVDADEPQRFYRFRAVSE